MPRAIGVYQRIAEKQPESGPVLLKLGTLFAIVEKWEDAENTLYRAHKTMGDDPDLLSNLGSVLIARGKYRQAIPLLKEAFKTERDREDAVALGIAHESLGNYSEALRYYREARSLGESTEALSRHIEELERLKPRLK